MDLNVTLILEILSFLILMGVLTKFLYRPILNFLDKRSAAVSSMIKEAEDSRNLAHKELEEAKDALYRTKRDALKIKDMAKDESEKIREKAASEAKFEREKILEKAKSEIERETRTALEKIRQEVADISIKIARKILGREIRGKDHEKFIREAVEQMKK